MYSYMGTNHPDSPTQQQAPRLTNRGNRQPHQEQQNPEGTPLVTFRIENINGI